MKKGKTIECVYAHMMNAVHWTDSWWYDEMLSQREHAHFAISFFPSPSTFLSLSLCCSHAFFCCFFFFFLFGLLVSYLRLLLMKKHGKYLPNEIDLLESRKTLSWCTYLEICVLYAFVIASYRFIHVEKFNKCEWAGRMRTEERMGANSIEDGSKAMGNHWRSPHTHTYFYES